MFLRLESLICFSFGDTTRKEAIGKPSLHSDYTRGRGIYSRYLTSDSGVSCSIEDNNDSLRSLTRFSRQTLCRALDESSHRQMVADAENSRRGRAQGGPQISRPSSLGSRRDGGQWTRLNSLTRHDASGIFGFRDLAAVLVCCYWLSEYETVETSGRRSARLAPPIQSTIPQTWSGTWPLVSNCPCGPGGPAEVSPVSSAGMGASVLWLSGKSPCYGAESLS